MNWPVAKALAWLAAIGAASFIVMALIPTLAVYVAGSVLARLSAEPDQCGDADLAAVLRTGRAVNEAVVALGEIALRRLRVALIESCADHQAEYSVAEKLEPLVAAAADARMGQGELVKADVAGFMPKLLADEGGDIGAHSATPV